MLTKYSIPVKHEHIVHQSENQSFDSVVLLLHGFQLDGYFMFKRFSKHFGEKVKVVSPNAPFMVPLKKTSENGSEWIARYGWYFYDSAKKNFYINYEPAAIWLGELIKQINPEAKPVSIIGYSQGGYLAPKAAEFIPGTKTVIGINSIFRSERFRLKDGVSYHQINGDMDDIVSPQEAKQEFEKMEANGNFLSINAGHPLNREFIEKSLELI